MRFDFDECIKSGVEQAMKECELTIGMTLKEAVEKQIPKKPIEDGYYDEPCVCPTCGGDVTNMADNDYHFQHCHYCGQKLDWSDTE